MITQTELSVSKGQDYWAQSHARKINIEIPTCDHEVPTAEIRLRQIGWIDQRGIVYPLGRLPIGGEFHGGSLTPLLINPGCD